MTPTTEEPPRRFFHVVRADKRALRIEADIVCEDGQWLNFKKDGERVGAVSKKRDLRAWWVEQEGAAGPFRCVDLGDSVLRCLCDEVVSECVLFRRQADGRHDVVRYRYEGQVTATIYQPIDAWWIEPVDHRELPRFFA